MMTIYVSTACPVAFEFQNYTIITSQCKGPKYSIELCCSSFKEFACPFTDEINDFSNDCALTMMTYISKNGNHPNGLFASLCREGKEGLVCPPKPPTSPNDDTNGGIRINERRILQALKRCPVNFEFQNYTIITSQCKGPNYSPKICCSALKEFACPFAIELNDLSTDCSKTMFSYIMNNGNYPDGLFSSYCREGKEGLSCPDLQPPSSSHTNNGGGRIIFRFQVLLLIMVADALFQLHL